MSPFMVALIVTWPLVSYWTVAETMSCDGAPALSPTGSVTVPLRISACAGAAAQRNAATAAARTVLRSVMSKSMGETGASLNT